MTDKPKCSALGCTYNAREDMTVEGKPYCGVHGRNYREWAERRAAQRRREAERSVRENVANFLTDQLGIRISAEYREYGGFIFSAEDGQRLYQCDARIVYNKPDAMKVEVNND